MACAAEWPLAAGRCAGLALALAGSYSLVNPAVTLLEGAGMGHEQLNGRVFAALPLTAAALGMILYGPAVVRFLQGLCPGVRLNCY